MSIVKEIEVKRIDSKSANKFIKKYHYSGKVVNNSSLHFGCFHNDKLHGVLSYGSSMDKNRTKNCVKNTKIHEFIELNRMAFDEYLPKNSESRCIAITLRLIKKHCPHIKWVLSFADGCQCGDGAIYRATGFHLIGIKKNTSLVEKDGEILSRMTLTCGKRILRTGKSSVPKEYKPLVGYQFKYIYFLHEDKKLFLNVPIIPYSKIKELGIGMYKGEKVASLV